MIQIMLDYFVNCNSSSKTHMACHFHNANCVPFVAVPIINHNPQLRQIYFKSYAIPFTCSMHVI